MIYLAGVMFHVTCLSHDCHCRDFPLIILTEYMNKGDLLGVLQDSRPHMDLHLQMRFAAEVADGMIYLSNEM